MNWDWTFICVTECNLDIQNDEKETILHWLARDGNDNVKFLQHVLEGKPNVNIQNKDGDTPLHLARAMGYTATSLLLIQSGARNDILNAKGQTPENIEDAPAEEPSEPTTSAKR